MISQTVEYALRAVVTIAHQGGRRCSTQAIAEATQVPIAYLAKVMRQLTVAGIADSRRGLHGGFKLTRQPDQLTLLDIVNAVDPIQRIVSCPLRLPAHDGNLCRLHQRLDCAIAEVEKLLRETVLADLLAHPENAAPLCEYVRVAGIETRPPDSS